MRLRKLKFMFFAAVTAAIICTSQTVPAFAAVPCGYGETEETDGTEPVETELVETEPAEAETSALTVSDATVTLYYLDDWASEYLSIPSDYETQYQISTSGANGNVSYSINSGSSAEVSSTGLIKPRVTTWYWVGNVGYSYYIEGATPTYEYKEGITTVVVSDGTTTKTITVNVVNYATYYAENVEKDFVANNITSSMSEYEKLKTITEYVAHTYSYNASYSGATSMIVSGGGDCWASTGLILKLCDLCGITAYTRYAANDAGAGSGHRNVIAYCDGKYYIADAGYTGSAPRYYDLYQSTGFSRSGSTIYQYDGFDKDVVVPSTIDSTTITNIGSSGKNVFYYSSVCKEITTISIPATISYLSEFAFAGCESLTAINVASGNETFQSIDGVVYSKDGTKIIVVPNGKTSYSFPSGVTTVGKYAFYYNSNIASVTIPSTVTTIEEGAFGTCTNLNRVVVPSSVTSIGTYAFYQGVSNLVVLSKTATFGNNVISAYSTNTIYGYAGSTAETYAQNNNINFVTIDNNGRYVGDANNSKYLFDVNGNKVTFTGLYNYLGTYYYFVEGKLSTDATLVKYNNTWWYVKNGNICRDETLVKYNNSWWYVKDGKLCTDETLVKYNNSWWYVKNGRLCMDETLVKYNNSWWYVKNGKLCKDETLVKYNNSWWYVKDGKLCKDETLVKYSNSWWYVKNGKLCMDETLVKYNNGWYYVRDGKWINSYNGTVVYNGTTYKITNGRMTGKA